VRVRLEFWHFLRACIYCLSKYKIYYYSTMISLAPTIYVGMQSMGGVGFFEVMLLAIFELLVCFFIHKRY